MSPRFVVLSGCSGGGKSTLLKEMARRGYSTVPEPGRRVIAEERQCDGSALPWVDPEAFCRRIIEIAVSDIRSVADDLVFFDRSALDAMIWYDRTDTPLEPSVREQILHLGYDPRVFLFPPWPEIFKQDEDRRHNWAAAIAEFEALCDRLLSYGFETTLVPKGSVAFRADWLEEQLE
ncbi:AAA family ATPase [uncultured Ruegeria sp.]|uniref:AAA family ATPase n=1 Tax=uncultured Ruegeria sp. TaxID=259304 RepID=UPI00261271E7|nr:AAA family ATPase [uncultured Ruegeria sp.]